MHFPPSIISGQDPATTWGAIAVGALTIVYVVFVRPLRKKKDPLERPPAAGQGGKMNLSRQRSVERDMGNLLVELSEMTRQMTAQLDTRAAKLEVLLREADDKLAALRAETRRDPGREPEDLPARPVDRGFHPPADEPADEHYVVSNTPTRAATLAEADARHAAIYALADEGYAAHDIARQLERPSGEIELILALRTGR